MANLRERLRCWRWWGLQRVRELYRAARTPLTSLPWRVVALSPSDVFDLHVVLGAGRRGEVADSRSAWEAIRMLERHGLWSGPKSPMSPRERFDRDVRDAGREFLERNPHVLPRR